MRMHSTMTLQARVSTPPGDFANLQRQLQAMNRANIVPFARALWNDAVAIKEILDTGVKGLPLLPLIRSQNSESPVITLIKTNTNGFRLVQRTLIKPGEI